jgi:hypothetical protein
VTNLELQYIFNELKDILKKYEGILAFKKNEEGYYDLWSIKDIVIDGRKRKEVFFAGLIIQKSYVGFYFMPIYTDTDLKEIFKPELLKLLKGKSCFHIRKLDEELKSQISEALELGFELYKEREWV